MSKAQSRRMCGLLFWVECSEDIYFRLSCAMGFLSHFKIFVYLFEPQIETECFSLQLSLAVLSVLHFALVHFSFFHLFLSHMCVCVCAYITDRTT